MVRCACTPARPKADATRAVIVIHEALGVTDYIEGVARDFADLGYHAVAPALFHRAGGGTAGWDDFDEVARLFEDLTDAGIAMDVGATVTHLHDQGFADGSIGIVGFCWGGRVTFLASLDASDSARRWASMAGASSAPRFPRLPALLGAAQLVS